MMVGENTGNEEFNEVVGFHGCYCLDIAMGYRVAKALVREMGEDMTNMKAVFAHAGTATCAIDAIQKITGCTLGKRNLILDDTGKPAFVLQNTETGRAVRAYCHCWDTHDHSALRQRRIQARKPEATPDDKAAFREMLDEQVAAILNAPESTLFRLEEVHLEAPPKSSKYLSEPCGICGEHADVGTMVTRNGARTCRECAGVQA